LPSEAEKKLNLLLVQRPLDSTDLKIASAPMSLVRGASSHTRADRAASMSASFAPTIFHITQYKAGSQWIYSLLLRCAPERIVEPKIGVVQILRDPIKAGYIYPTVYLSKTDFDMVKKPDNSRCFVILRDLRDILVSMYFSFKVSHPEMGEVNEMRRWLNAVDLEEGLLLVLREWLLENANICSSWIDAQHEWIRYEDLLGNDVEILEGVLIDRCGLQIDREVFREHVLNCRFSKLSGRMPGQADPNSHFRKGIAGDWRNYFTPKIKEAFKRQYGNLLLKSGYEKSNDW
jgi:Sulfotransferase domain